MKVELSKRLPKVPLSRRRNHINTMTMRVQGREGRRKHTAKDSRDGGRRGR